MKPISVTTALSPYTDFSMVPPDVLEYASDRGTRTHAFCLSYALGLYTGRVDDDCAGFFASFKTWFDSYISRVFFVEKEFHHPTYLYVGHPDMACRLIDGRNVIVDLKTPAVESKTWRAQLAAYLELMDQTPDGLDFTECMALILKKNGGTARAIVYQYSDRDFAAFLSALNATRYFK